MSRANAIRMQLRTLLAILLFISWTDAIPPESFGFPSAPNDTMLSVTFQSGSQNVVVSEAELLGPDVPAQAPFVAVNPSMYTSIATYHGSYMVIMVDPDASTPQNPNNRFLLHWAQPNLTANAQGVLTNTSSPFVPYARPSPAPTSDPHRYILYAFQQPMDLTSIPEQFAGFSATNRSHFNLTQFISAANLGQPAAANYFFLQNKTGTPAMFTAPAGSSYPGGNGGAITDGPGPMVTPTPSQNSAGGMTSATGSATSTAASTESTGGAANVKQGVELVFGLAAAAAFGLL